MTASAARRVLGRLFWLTVAVAALSLWGFVWLI